MMGGGMGGGLGGGMMGGRMGRAGGLAMIASLAYQAYRQWEANRPPAPQGGGQPGGFGGQRHGAFAPVPAAAPQRSGGFLPSAEEAAAMLGGTRFAPASTADEETLARALLTAMIAAAKADGQIDADEQARIFGEMDRHDLDPDDKAFLMDALRAPLDIDAVARLARSPEEATEIYAASVMAIRSTPSRSGATSTISPGASGSIRASRATSSGRSRRRPNRRRVNVSLTLRAPDGPVNER